MSVSPDIYVTLIDTIVVPLGVVALMVLGAMQSYLLYKYKKLSALVFWENASKRELFIIKASFFCFISSIIMGIVLSLLSNYP